MFLKPLEFLAKYSLFTWRLLSFFLLPLVGATAWAAAPPVVIDSQLTLGSGYNYPQSATVNNTNQGAIFIADTYNNQIVALVNGFPYYFNPPGYTLSSPQAIALDAKGDLFVADTPSSNGTSYGRVIEMPADNTGNLTGTAEVFYSGAPLTNPISLAIDSSGTVFIGDYPASGVGAIYSSPSIGTTPTLLTFTGLNSPFTPASLLRDSANNLYIADNGNGASGAAGYGGIYKAPATGGAASQVSTQSFVINQPSGLATDAAGDLFILSLLGDGSTGQQVVIVPAASPSSPYIIPNNGIGTSSSVAIDASGNVDVLSSADAKLYQLNYLTPTNMGYINVGQAAVTPFPFNFEFNAAATLNGFSVVTQGDASTDLTQVSGGTCATGTISTGASGGAISPYNPYTCLENYEGTAQYPGGRDSAILVKGPGTTILGSAPVYQIGFAGVEITYPLNATVTATNLQEPQAIAISGLNHTVYVADTQAGVVYATDNLNGTTLTPVPTGSFTLQAPSAVALDAAGNLYIGDFNLGEVIKVPVATGGSASLVIPPGGLLQHPIAMTVNSLGDLYVGDAGPGGLDASTSNPGFVIRVPAGGTAYKLPLPTTAAVVFPQALTTDFYTNFLFIGDGGDQSSTGEVVVTTADGTVGGPVALSGVTNPTGVGFDPAGALYVLDGTANTITIDPIYSGADPYLLDFDNSSLAAASAMGMSSGGQSFVIANIGAGSTNLVLINGDRSTLSFGNVQENTTSQTKTATEYNIGNAALTLGSPYYTTTAANPAFTILNSSTCSNSVQVQVGNSCSINVQFKPAFLGHTTEQIKVQSDAYNSGTPQLLIQGTGSATGSVAKPKKKK